MIPTPTLTRLAATLTTGMIVAGLMALAQPAAPARAQQPPRAERAALGALPPPPPCEGAPLALAMRLAALQGRLSLKPDQAPAWQAYVTDLRQATQPLEDLCRAHRDGADARAALDALAGDPVAVLAAHEKPIAALHATAVAIREASARLAGQLDPAQKLAFAAALLADGPGPFGPFPPPPRGPHDHERGPDGSVDPADAGWLHGGHPLRQGRP